MKGRDINMSDLISGIGSSAYSNAAGSSTAVNSLENKLNSSDLSNATDEELMSVCQDFEAYFVEQMFKALEKMVPKDEEESSSSMTTLTDYFKGELTSQYASDAAKSNGGQGFGIAQTLYEQMKRTYGSSEIPTADENSAVEDNTKVDDISPASAI